MDGNCKKIDGKDFEQMLAYGLSALTAKESEVNKLNVFPIPDGDTGSNMRMTYASGLSSLRGKSTENIGEAANTFARGMLLGARGNSGVILSQIFKGIAIGLTGLETADCGQLCNALAEGVKKSYKAVVKPVEGTMLTVFRESSEYVAKNLSDGMTVAQLLKLFLEECEKSLKRTPDLLAVLKEAGVIDSGGAGVLYIFRGISACLNGEAIEGGVDDGVAVAAAADADGEEFGYCTEFLLKLSDKYIDTFKVEEIVAKLENLGGESIVALRDEDIVKVHVHVMTPGNVLNIAQQYGEFITIKVENMTVQHNHLKEMPDDVKAEVVAARERCSTAVVAVADGNGFNDLFYNLGADFVVSGGQSMNPSVEDFLNAFNTVNADNIIVLPNNSNIILTANQAKDMYKGSNVHVVRTKNLSQGFSALSIYNPDESVEEIIAEMNEAKGNVVAMEITFAIRDAYLDGVDIKKDEAMAIVDGKVGGAGKTCYDAFCSAIKSAPVADKSVMTMFIGKGAVEEQTNEMISYVQSLYPDMEVGTVVTNQKVYNYIVAIE